MLCNRQIDHSRARVFNTLQNLLVSTNGLTLKPRNRRHLRVDAESTPNWLESLGTQVRVKDTPHCRGLDSTRQANVFE